MSPGPVQIAPRRSLALLALLMVVVSYGFVLLLAWVCLLLPYLFFDNLEHVPGQLMAESVGAAIAGLTILLVAVATTGEVREAWGITGQSLASDMPDAPGVKETTAM